MRFPGPGFHTAPRSTAALAAVDLRGYAEMAARAAAAWIRLARLHAVNLAATAWPLAFGGPVGDIARPIFRDGLYRYLLAGDPQRHPVPAAGKPRANPFRGRAPDGEFALLGNGHLRALQGLLMEKAFLRRFGTGLPEGAAGFLGGYSLASTPCALLLHFLGLSDRKVLQAGDLRRIRDQFGLFLRIARMRRDAHASGVVLDAGGARDARPGELFGPIFPRLDCPAVRRVGEAFRLAAARREWSARRDLLRHRARLCEERLASDWRIYLASLAAARLAARRRPVLPERIPSPTTPIRSIP